MKSIWIISQNSGTPKKGEFKDTFFFSRVFNQHQIKTTIIFNSNNHLLKTPIKKGLILKRDVTFMEFRLYLNFLWGFPFFFR